LDLVGTTAVHNRLTNIARAITEACDHVVVVNSAHNHRTTTQ
jgi:hypothetical protein